GSARIASRRAHEPVDRRSRCATLRATVPVEQRPTNERGAAPRFRLEAEIGAGATGRVHRATLLEPLDACPAGTAVAVKYLHAHLEGDARALARFDAEARAGTAVRHPGVVRVLATG